MRTFVLVVLVCSLLTQPVVADEARSPGVAPGAARAEPERRGAALLAAGVTIGAVGTVGVGVGAALYASGKEQCADAAARTPRSGESLADAMAFLNACTAGQKHAYAGIGTMVASGVFILAGAPLAIVGGIQLSSATASATPRVLIGDRAAALRWSF